MQAISLWLAAAIVILTGWAIVKKYQVNMVLFIAGLLLNIIGVMNGATNFLPKNATATGLLGFDFFELFRAICRTQIAGVGFIILVSGGFAQYMKDVGASDRFVTVCAKPITLLKNPYLILGLVFIIGHCLGLVITSAAGLAMLLIVTVYPLIIRVGCSSLSAAAVVASVLCVGYAPASGVAVMAAELVHLDPVEYLVSYQLVMAAPVVLVMAITHVIVQRYFDKKDGVHGYVADFAELEAKRKELEKTPLIYACMPVLPLVLLLIFNKMVYKTITMNVATAMFLSWFVCFLVLIDVAKNCGLGVTGTGVVLSAIIGVVTVLTGSGVAAFTSLAHVIPDVAQHLNSNGIAIMLMMHTASEMLRALSPVAGVIIIVAGFAKVSPFAIIKRTAIPCVVGYITMLIIVSAIF